MKFGGIGIPELVIILVVVLLIFGPKNLPKLGSALGKTVKNLRDGMGGEGELEEATDDGIEVVEEAANEGPFSEPDAKPVKKVKKVVKKVEADADDAVEVVEEVVEE